LRAVLQAGCGLVIEIFTLCYHFFLPHIQIVPGMRAQDTRAGKAAFAASGHFPDVHQYDTGGQLPGPDGGPGAGQAATDHQNITLQLLHNFLRYPEKVFTVSKSPC
jgi:hypothetical protein